jgi:hypothetical protein
MLALPKLLFIANMLLPNSGKGYGYSIKFTSYIYHFH